MKKQGMFPQRGIMIWNFSYSNMINATAKLLNLLDSKEKLYNHRSTESLSPPASPTGKGVHFHPANTPDNASAN